MRREGLLGSFSSWHLHMLFGRDAAFPVVGDGLDAEPTSRPSADCMPFAFAEQSWASEARTPVKGLGLAP